MPGERQVPCPYCKERTVDVVDSRVRSNGNIKRRRRCFTCGSKWSTRELIDGPPGVLLESVVVTFMGPRGGRKSIKLTTNKKELYVVDDGQGKHAEADDLEE